MAESNWNTKVHWNHTTKRMGTKWNRKKRSLRNSTISGNRRRFYVPKVGLNQLNSKELKQLLKKQMTEMTHLVTKNKLLTEKNTDSSEKDSVSNPILKRSNSPIKKKLIVARKKPMPWTIERRSRLTKKDYNNQTERLLRNK